MRAVKASLLALLCLGVSAVPAAAGTPAGASDSPRTIRFAGESVRVPAGWPVIRLAQRPNICVRLDRAVVYLGTPRSNQRCAATAAVGGRRAILVDPRAEARAARAAAQARRLPPATVSAASEYTGLGFDACAAPSRAAMRAWKRKSPYRAIGVYIGGSNRACSQPNLTASWVADRIDEGWHLIPTYVGLQATTSSCSSCASLSPSSATLQGTAAASDAVRDMKAIGLGEGSPIYFDMESYTRTASATSSTLKFLAAWTRRLHALGYDSGVYSSSGSGIRDLVGRLGTTYPLPDDIWMANWDGRKTTDDPYVPESAWADHQRIRQYRGGHDETWGGVTINIDNNYVEGATAGAGFAAATPDDPLGDFETLESENPGEISVAGWAYDPNAPRRPVTIQAYVGASKQPRSGRRHDLGRVADKPRPDVADLYPRAGEAHGFEETFAAVGSGKKRVCLYAEDIRLGNDRFLGCRGVEIEVPVTISEIESERHSLRVHVRCEWPVAAQCPGQILLRARVRVRVPVRRGGRRALATRVRTAAIARRGFRLRGGRSHTFRVALSRRGRALTRGRPTLASQLVVAIPGGRRTTMVSLR